MTGDDWDYYRPGPGTGLKKHRDGTHRTADGRFVVSPTGYQGSTHRWRTRDTKTGKTALARTLLDARNDIRHLRAEDS